MQELAVSLGLTFGLMFGGIFCLFCLGGMVEWFTLLF